MTRDPGDPRLIALTLDGAVIPCALTYSGLTIRRGRIGVLDQPEAATCRLTVADPGGAIRSAVRVNASTLAVDVDGSRRFTGAVRDASFGWPGGIDAAPVLTLTASDVLADLATFPVGDVPWPVESDGDRIARVVALTPHPAGALDPGTDALAARDVDRRPALDVLRQAARSALGLIFAARDGRLTYHDADHRAGAAPAAALDDCDLYAVLAWETSTEGLVTSVEVSYGPAATPSSVSADSPAAEALYGRRHLYRSTDLAAADAALDHARDVLSRLSRPEWRPVRATVDVDLADPPARAALLALELGARVDLARLPAAGPASQARAWLEGWVETITGGRHTMTLDLGPWAHYAPAPGWDDVCPATTWDDVDPGLSWDGAARWDASCHDLGDPAWDAVPADVRWQTAGDLAWNEWSLTRP